MNQPSLWSAFLCAFFMHILLLGGFTVYATKGVSFRMPQVYRVRIVTPPPEQTTPKTIKGPSGHGPVKKGTRRAGSLKKGVTLLKRIEKIKKAKAKRRQTILKTKRQYKEEKALEEALERVHTEKIAEIKRRLQLKKMVLESIAALPPRTGLPASRDVQRYAARVSELIKAEWVFPEALAQRQFSVEVTFRVKANGEVEGISILHSSGNSLFDASVVKAIKKASPLPPPPPGGEEITVRFRTEAKQ